PMGSTPDRIDDLRALTTAARQLLIARDRARAAARSANQRYQAARRAMVEVAATVIQDVRTKAATDGGQAYRLALVPPPAKRSPMAPPGEPTRITATMNQVGELALRW